MPGRHHHKRSAILDMWLFTIQEFSVQGKVFMPSEQCDYNFQLISQIFLKNENRILQRGSMILIINIFIKYFHHSVFQARVGLYSRALLCLGGNVISFGQRVVYGSDTDHLWARICRSWCVWESEELSFR